MKTLSKPPLQGRRSTQLGATLIEALVSILLFSLGLLGVAGMQLSALTFQKSSWATNRVAEVAIDIGERMRANPDGVTLGRYTYTENYTAAAVDSLANGNCRTSGEQCSGAQIANDDLSAWLRKAQTTLPQGAVHLEGSAANGFTATVMYMDKDFTDPAANNALQSSAVCTAATNGIAWRNCCPAAAAAPVGVRCSRAFIQPFVPQ